MGFMDLIAGAATAPLRPMTAMHDIDTYRNPSAIGAGGHVTRPYDRWVTMDFMDLIAGAPTVSGA